MALAETKGNPLFGATDLMRFLPHRYPFLLVDKVLEMDVEEGVIVGQKNLTMNEAFFQGHFPGAPVMPGVLTLEALAQCGAVLVKHRIANDKIAVLLSVTNAKFRTPARPGDTLLLRCEGIHFGRSGGRVKGVATVDGKVSAEGEIGFAFMDKTQI